MITNDNTDVFGDLLIESSIDAMIATDGNDKILVWNKAATVFFKVKKDEAIGKPLPAVLVSAKSDEEFLEAIAQAKKGNKSFLPATPAFTHRAHVETHIIPIKISNNARGVMLLVHDVSHRIANEKELQALNSELQKRLRQLNLTTYELANLTHIATHNVKEPLRTIYTAIEFVIQSEVKNMTDNGRASFRRIQSALTRVSLLLDDVITLTQINIAQQPEHMVDMEELVHELTSALKSKFSSNNVQFTTGSLCEIRAHRNQVILLIQHILLNAIRFNKSEKPRLHLNCEKVKLKEGDYYRLSITHNGDGFEAKKRGTSFEFNVNPEEKQYNQSAIASIIAAKVMEAHGGFLEIEQNKPGETEVKCYFPSESPQSC